MQNAEFACLTHINLLHTTSDYTRTHYITPNNELLGFLEFLKRLKVSETSERELHNCFYNSSLNNEATSSLPRQHEHGFHYIQKFYKSHTNITLLNKETHKIFD